MRKVNPLTDLVFKKFMGEKGDEVQLQAFLEAVLDRKLKDIEIVEATELPPDIIGDKLSRLDVRAKSGSDTDINIEVQLKDHRNMDKRSLFYWSRLFGKSLKAGSDNDYNMLPNVITINILKFDFLDEPEEEFHNIYHIRNDRSGKILTDSFEIHFLEFKKFLRLKEKDIVKNAIHRWLAFLDNNISEKILQELIEMDTAIRQANKKIEYISNDEATYHQIMLRELAVLDYNSDVAAAKREGKAEADAEKIAIAKSLLGILDIATITEKFKLTSEEVEKMQN